MDGPQTPKKKKSWKKMFTITAGVIGLLASTSTVVALIWGWFEPEPDVSRTVMELKQQQDESLKAQKSIEQKLAKATEDDGDLVNQVSRQVTRLADEHKKLRQAWSDIQKLAAELRGGPKTASPIPVAGGVAQVGRSQERKALARQVQAFRQRAKRFCADVRDDADLAKVKATDSQAGTLKARAKKQAQEVCGQWLPALDQITKEFELD